MTVDIERGDYNLINTMADSEPQHEAYTINRCLEKDDDNEFKKIIEKHKGNDVSQPCIPSYLHKAAEKGALKCLQFLLDILSSPDILDLPDDYSRTPLMVAVAKAQPRAVEMLLKAGAHVNARNNKGQSSLHLLVFALQRGVLSEEALQEIVDLLLKHENIDLEPHSDSNLTPLATAITRMPEEDGAPQKSSLITFCKKLVKVGASLKASAGDGTVEEVLQKKRALTSILMEIILPPAPSRPFTSEFLDMIILGKSTDEIKDFLINKDARIAVNYRLGSQTLLFRAVDKGDEELVKYLLATGANSWASEVTGELPIFRAVARSNYKILDHLINYMKLNNKVDLQRYTLTLIQKLMESAKKAKDCTPEESQSKCLERLLKSDVLLNLNQVPEDGKTPLHVAANFNNQETLSALLSHGAFLGARRTVKGKNKGHVLKALHPSTLKSAMDDCISFHPENSDVEEAENVLGENYTLDLDYRFLVPPVNKDKKTEDESKNEMETLMEISKSKVHRKAIKHPLVRALLFAKWHKALPLYIFNVSIYLFFVSILTAFVYNLKDLRILEVRQDNTLNSERNNSTLAEDILCKQSTVNILRGFLIPAAIYIVIKEVFQIVFSHNMYLKNIENYLQWFLVIVVFVLSFTPLDADVTRHLAAWTMIIAWYEFVLTLGRAPSLAIYITMLRHVSWNFLKFIFLYGALILSFAVSFNIILQPSEGEENTDFRNFWSTLPKVIVMGTGEFEYSVLSEHFSRKILFLTSAVLVFLLFLFLIFLVVMNIMTGLAVSNTKEVVEDAILYSLTSRLEFVYLIESLFLKFPGVKKHVSKTCLLTGSQNTPILRAKINKAKQERLATGKSYTRYIALDDDTANTLREHRVEQLNKDEQQRRGDPISQCLSILQDLQERTSQHPLNLQKKASNPTSN